MGLRILTSNGMREVKCGVQTESLLTSSGQAVSRPKENTESNTLQKHEAKVALYNQLNI
jgi:hypothetical protein